MTSKDKDTPESIRKAFEDLGTRCPKCHSINTVELNKSGSKRECMSCGKKYDV